MLKDKKLVKCLGESTLRDYPKVYIGYGIYESYGTQLSYLTKTLDDYTKKAIYDKHRSIAGDGSIVSDPNNYIALEELCKEVEFYLDYIARKIPNEDVPKSFNVGSMTIMHLNDYTYWGCSEW